MHYLKVEASGGAYIDAGHTAFISSITTSVPIELSSASGKLGFRDGYYAYPSPIPEPETLALSIIGLGVILARLRRTDSVLQ